MSLFDIKGKKLVPIKDRQFGKEEDLHKLIEANLEALFGLEYVASEFTVEGYYIDTLAFDPESNTFVIIEYKKDKGFSVVDQGLHYLQLMFKHKADFLLTLSEKKGKFIDRKSIDWSQSRVMFLAKSFTPYQIGSTSFRDFPIELWQVSLYENGFLDLSPVQATKTTESITQVAKGKAVAEIAGQVEEYSVDEHRKRGDEKTQEIFDSLREQILSIDSSIKEKPTKYYIGYKTHGTNFVSLIVKQNRIIVSIRLVKPEPSTLEVIKQRKRGWDTTPLWAFNINDSSQLHKAADLITQAYKYYESKFK